MQCPLPFPMPQIARALGCAGPITGAAQVPLTRDLVLVGGGHAHALVLRRFGMRPIPGVRLTLINPDPTAPYTGMLPGHVAGHYPRAALDIDLVNLARFAGARLILDRAVGIDREKRQILLGDRGPVHYDIAALDIGIHSAMPDLPGFAAHGTPAKPLGRFADAWAAFVAEATQSGRAEVAVLGGGVAGAELAMAMAHRLRSAGVNPAVVRLIDRAAPLGQLPARSRTALLSALADAGIEILADTAVAELTPSGLITTDGRTIASGLTVGAAGAWPYRWLQDTGLALTGGYVDVGADLRSTSDPAIYASGDCAHLTASPRPKAGVYAVRAAKVLAHNLRADLTGSARRPFRPPSDFLKLASLGGKDALGAKWGVTGRGAAVWRLKDHIDRRFMRRLAELPVMTPPGAPPGAATGVAQTLAAVPMPCAGCGAKIAGPDLARALRALPLGTRPDIETTPGDDAAVLRIGGIAQVISSDHLRAFTSDPWLLGRVAAVHALGDVWAMGAAPQAALSTIILPRMRPRMAAETLAEITAAAALVFGSAGAQIVGGHTTSGAELTVGFTVTGLLEPGQKPVLLGGAQPGDRLIVTKPIGTGVVLAGAMAGKASGADVAATWAQMAVPQGEAAQVFRAAGGDLHAMTDVTGFGLAGHLAGIARASGLGASLTPGAVPLLPGALALSEAGIRSSLYPGNLAHAGLSDTLSPRAALMADPQTGGGLLAAVAPGAFPQTLRRLHDLGLPAADIGEMTDGAPEILLTGS